MIARTLIFCFLIVAATFLGGSVSGQGKTGRSPDAQKEYDELIKSAKRSSEVGVLAAQAGAGCVCLLLFFGAYSVFRHGLKVSESKRIEGTAGRSIAVVMALTAIGIGVVALVYLPSVMP